eukprot:1740463-Rhodomonas_salina.1
MRVAESEEVRRGRRERRPEARATVHDGAALLRRLAARRHAGAVFSRKRENVTFGHVTSCMFLRPRPI